MIRKLIPLYIGAMVGPMGGFGMVPLIPVLARDWQVNFSHAALAITFYMTPFIVLQIFSGSLSQIFSTRRTLIFGFSVYIMGAILTGISWDFSSFMVARIVQGSGAAFLTPIIMALIGTVVPPHRIGTAMGGLGLAYTVGVTMGPLISGFLEVRFQWPGFFFFLALAASGACFMYIVWCRDVEKTSHISHPSLREVFPLIKRALLEPGLLSISFGAFFLFLAYIGIMTFTADYLKTIQRLPSHEVGFILSLTGFSGIPISPLAGLAGDRWGRRPVFLIGAAVVFSSITLMYILPFSTLTFSLLFFLLGSGAAIAWTSLNTMAVETSTTVRNAATSLYNVIKFSGYALSPVILSLFYRPGRLEQVQMACLLAVAITTLLVINGKRKN
ncbi:MAG: MFS transporter [Syntrophales bacterium]|nr:MFS transporter [Syntrophales bacterium]